MLTGIHAARNVTGGEFDVWAVNVEEQHHESWARSTADRGVPRTIVDPENRDRAG
jgi:hypothetical protein